VKTLQEHTEIVTSFVWIHKEESRELNSPSKHANPDLQANGNFISSSLDKTIKIWKNFQCVTTLKDHNDWIRCLALSKDNQFMVSGCVSSVIVGWDLNNISNTNSKSSTSGAVMFKIPGAHKSTVSSKSFHF
jgi:WD40 repeat protein